MAAHIRLAFGGLLLALSLGCGLFTRHNYSLASGIEPGAVVVEYENPSCFSLREHPARELLIPASAYLCTSSRLDRGRTLDRYFILDKGGKRRALKIGKSIHSRALVERHEGGCQIVAEVFLYAPEGTEPQRDSWSMIIEKHPECDIKE